jgi:hypothetical protein
MKLKNDTKYPLFYNGKVFVYWLAKNKKLWLRKKKNICRDFCATIVLQ